MPRPLAALLAAALFSALAWALVLPPFQGADELSHYSYVARLVETQSLPRSVERQDGRFFPSDTAPLNRWQQDAQLVANPYARPAWTKLEERRYGEEEGRLPGSAASDGTGASPAGNNGPVYYAYEAVPYALASSGSVVDRVYLTRVAGIAWLLAAVVFTWLLAGELLGGAVWKRTLAAGAVALVPGLTQEAGIVTPDIALAALWTALLWVAVRMVRRGPDLRWTAGLGALAIAAAATHPRGGPALLVALFAAGLAWRRRIPPWGLALLAVGAVGVVAAAFAFAPSNLPLLGGSAKPLQVREFLSYLWQFYLPKLGFMSQTVGAGEAADVVYVNTFFGAFAWQEVVFPPLVYDLLKWISLAGLAALGVCLAIRRPRWDLVALVAVAVLAVLLTLHLTEYWSLLNTGVPVISGRDLFPLAGLAGCAIAYVASTLPRRAAPYVAAAVLGGGILLTVGGLLITAARFHA